MNPALIGWKREGLVWVPPPDLCSVDEPDPEWAIRPPEPDVDDEPAETDGRVLGTCLRCGRPVQKRSKVCADCRDVERGVTALEEADREREDYMTQEDRLWETLARTMAVPLPPIPLGHTCACGCLLAAVDELCPQCVIPWMRRAEVEHLNQQTVYHFTTTEMRAA